MKVRVVPHQEGRASTYWCIEYRLSWWSGWERLTQANLYGEPHLDRRDFPVLLSLDEAKRRAASLTTESIREWNKEQDKIFANGQRIAQKKIAKNRSIKYEITRP